MRPEPSPEVELGSPWIDAADMLGTKIEPPDWIVRGLIARGDIAVLAAPAAHGKSLLALDLAIGLALGDTALGGLEVLARGRTAFLELEMNRERTIRYFSRLALGRGISKLQVIGRLGFWVNRPYMIDVDSDRETLIGELSEFHQAGPVYGLEAGLDLIVVDTMRRCLNGDEQDSGAVSAFFSGLRAVVAALGNPAVLVLHHFRKQGQNDRTESSERIRGSSDILNAVDHAYIVASKHSGRHRIETVKSRERELEPFTVRFDGYGRDDEPEETLPGLMLVREDAVNDVLDRDAELRRDIIDLLESCPPEGVTRPRVIATLKGPGRSARTIDTAFRHLVTLGVVKSPGRVGGGRAAVWSLAKAPSQGSIEYREGAGA